MGSTVPAAVPPQQLVLQHEAFSAPSITACAASPYFAFTVSLSALIDLLPGAGMARAIYS
jgi:hypothetical protein